MAAILLLLVGCATPGLDKSAPSIKASAYGQISFEASGDPKAYPVFIEGLLMLHNFEYKDARKAFLRAQQIDPNFVMAYWGEALSHEHPLWNVLDLAAARAALDKLSASPEGRVAKAQTAREKAYIDSVNQLFGQGSDTERDYSYMRALKNLSQNYPNDLDARALYALSILATSHGGRDFTKYMQAGAITEEILDRNPTHPGALHYNIHSFDDPVHAPLGLRAARLYSDVAPAAVHALHMPAHIFFAVGDYNRASELNIRSFAASLDGIDIENQPITRGGYHSLTWLIYSQLQESKLKAAKENLAIIGNQLEQWGDSSARANYISSSAHYMITTQDWNDPLGALDIDTSDLRPYVQATDIYVKARRFIQLGEVEQARSLISNLPTASDSNDTRPALHVPYLTRLVIEGLIEQQNGNAEAARNKLVKAADLEDSLSPSIGPPLPAQPSSEVLGDVLLEQGDYIAAMASYKRTLARFTNRARSLNGVRQARLQLGLPTLKNAKVLNQGLTAAGLPTQADLANLTEQGFSRVIDLRSDMEKLSSPLADEVKSRGMEYVSISIASPKDLTLENAALLDSILSQETEGETLLHCASGNRVGALLALRASMNGASASTSLNIGRNAGLTSLSEAVESKLE